MIMKLIAFRDLDRVHIRDLLKVGLIDDAIAEQIPPELRRVWRRSGQIRMGD